MAQTLARPGWAGSGMTVERWWKHAVVVDVVLPSGAEQSSVEVLQRASERLDQMRGIGVDAVLLRGFGESLSTNSGAAKDLSAERSAADAAMDELLGEASRRGIRVLVEVRGDVPAAELASTARMWLNRGVAGIEVAGGGAEAARTVRGAMHLVRGDRLLVSGDAAGGDVPSAVGARAAAGAADLRLVQIVGLGVQGGAAALRSSVEGAAAAGSRASGVLLEARASEADAAALARVQAAVTLLSVPGAALVEESSLGAADAVDDPVPLAAIGNGLAAKSQRAAAEPQRVDEHGVAAQVRQMTGLHHDRAPFLVGSTTVLDHDAEHAAVWLRRGAGGAALVVACNVSAQPIRLSLVDDMARQKLRGTFLKTISRSDNGLGAMPLDAVTVPAYGVYVGELSR